MVVSPARAECKTFHRATLIWAWWHAERNPNFLFSSSAAFIISGSAPKNLMPSAPFFAFCCTHSRACSGVVMGFLLPCPKPV